MAKLSDIERQMCSAYIQVHARKINRYMRDAKADLSRDIPETTARKRALEEARGVVAALERLIADDASDV